MRGRDLSRLAAPITSLMGALCRLLPRTVAATFFSLVRFVPGIVGLGLRYVLLKRLCRHCGNNVAVFESAFILHPENLSIGSNVSIHQMCYLDGAGGISIGSDVSIAHATTVVSSNHDYSVLDKCIKDTPPILEPVAIADDVWIGAGVRVLAGVRIGSRCVIGAGAVVTKSIPPGSIAVGMPARVIRTLSLKGDENRQ